VEHGLKQLNEPLEATAADLDIMGATGHRSSQASCIDALRWVSKSATPAGLDWPSASLASSVSDTFIK